MPEQIQRLNKVGFEVPINRPTARSRKGGDLAAYLNMSGWLRGAEQSVVRHKKSRRRLPTPTALRQPRSRRFRPSPSLAI